MSDSYQQPYLYPPVYVVNDCTGESYRVPESNDGKSRADVIADYQRQGFRVTSLFEFVTFRAAEYRRQKEQVHGR